MPPTNQHTAAARRVYETYWDSYLNGDLETFASTLDDNYEMIGISESEASHITRIRFSITHDIVKAHGGEILVNTKKTMEQHLPSAFPNRIKACVQSLKNNPELP
jgi:hypothetical protein